MTDPPPAPADGPDGGFEDPPAGPAATGPRYPAEPATAEPAFTCPSCGHLVPAGAAAADGLLACPACGAEFFAAVESSAEDHDLAERMEADRRRQEEVLNARRIRQVLTERRALFRTRSYFVVLACLAIVAAAQLVVLGSRAWRAEGAGGWAAGYAAAAAGLLYAGRACVRRIRLYNREVAKPLLDEPTVEPDFSTLSDGSQRVAEAAANLERMDGRG